MLNKQTTPVNYFLLQFSNLTCSCYIPLLAPVLFLSLASPANAAFMVLAGNNPQPNDQNVLNSNDQIGSTITAALNQSGEVVTFTSPSQTLFGPANGQARVEATSGGNQVDINDSIIVGFQNPVLRFTSIIFNSIDGAGSLTINIMGENPDNSPANASITLDNGNNPLTLATGRISSPSSRPGGCV